jgi:hypothetical protein
LDIFSDATDLKNTLVLFFSRHLTPIIDSERGRYFYFWEGIFYETTRILSQLRGGAHVCWNCPAVLLLGLCNCIGLELLHNWFWWCSCNRVQQNIFLATTYKFTGFEGCFWGFG